MEGMCINVAEDGQVCSEVDINGVLELARTTWLSFILRG